MAIARIGVVAIVTTLHPVEYTATASVDATTTSKRENNAANNAADNAAVVDTTTLKINLASEPDYLDPALNSSVDGGCLAVNSFVGLHTYDATGALVPALASEYSVSEDGTVYTFTVIDSKWSNGDALTAKDFAYSWQRVADPATAADYSYLFAIIAANDDGTLKVEATDDNTLVVTLVSPCPYFLDLTAFPTFFPVHQASVEAANPDGVNPGAWAQEAGFVCNGAYTLESWSHNESMVYVKNPNYYDAANVTMEKLEFMLSADDTAIYAAYNSNDLDFIDSVPNDEIQAVLNNSDFYKVDQLGTYYIGFNVNADLFAGKTVEQAAKMRQALSLMMDRSYIADQIGQTGQIPADSFVPQGMADGNGGIFNTADDEGYYDATVTGPTQAAAAMALLEEAGYKKDANGIYFSTELTIFDGFEDMAEVIISELKTIGIECKLNVIEYTVWEEKVWANQEYDFTAVAGFQGPDVLGSLRRWTKDGTVNVNGWSHPEIEKIVEKVLACGDQDQINQYMKDIQVYLADEVTILPMVSYVDHSLFNKNIHGHPMFSNDQGGSRDKAGFSEMTYTWLS